MPPLTEFRSMRPATLLAIPRLFCCDLITFLLCQLAVGVVGLQKHMNLVHAIFVLLMYPASLALVWVLENEVGLD